MFYTLSGANEIKGPVSYLAFDTITWALIGLASFQKTSKINSRIFVPALLLVFLIFPPRLSGLHKMDISPLVDFEKIENSFVVDSHSRPESMSCGVLDNIECDAVSAYFGLRVFGDDKTSKFITNDFIRKSQ